MGLANDKTVIKNGDVLYLFCGRSGDDEYKGCHGFQPNVHTVEKLFKVTNIKDKTIYIWITVHGVFKEYDWFMFIVIMDGTKILK